MEQIIQVAGALFVLIAFVLAQAKVLDQRSYAYLVLNLAGSAVLAVLALVGREWGFLLLEGSWAIVSAISLIGRLRPAHSTSTQAT